MENHTIITIILIISAYLLGSFPSGVVIGKVFKKIDIREHGSKNVGTTNAIRVLGKKLGLVVFLLDVAKVALIALIVKYNTNLTPYHYTFFGYFGLFGHMYPVFTGFKGGKAVASGFGLALVFTPLQALAAITVFFITIKISKYVSVGSVTAAIAYLIFIVVWPVGDQWYKMADADRFYLVLFGSITVLGILYKHIPNYKRLLKGEENKIGQNKLATEANNA